MDNSTNLQDFQQFPSFVVHYGEIALKKGNRKFFEDSLLRNIRVAIGNDNVCGVRRLRGRVHIRFNKHVDGKVVLEKLSKVFGVANIKTAVHCEASLEAIEGSVRKIISGRTFGSFAIRANRAEKGFPVTSQKVNETIGAVVKTMSGARVDLTNPEFVIPIEILNKEVFVCADLVKGPGGLPVGVSGRALCLISGGIDSPVAAFRVMKRGCLPLFLHFHSAPFTSDASQEKVIDMVEEMMKGQPATELIIVPFGQIQQKIIVTVPSAYRVIIYRRFMMKIAERIALRKKAMVLVTGDALSQVASQTLSNLCSIDAAVKMPILRPLIGMDKQEIVDEAKRIGTYDVSIKPHDDCCSFLMPPNPVTKTKISEVEDIEKKLDIESLINLGLESLKIIGISNT